MRKMTKLKNKPTYDWKEEEEEADWRNLKRK